MNQQSSRHAFTILFIALVVVGGALVMLYLNHSRSREEHVKRRNHLQLSLLAQRLAGKLEGVIDDETSKANGGGTTPPCGNDYALVSKGRVPFEGLRASNGKWVGLHLAWKSGDPYLALQVADEKQPALGDETCLRAEKVAKLLEYSGPDHFDELLLIDATGPRVLYQRNKQAMGQISDHIVLVGDGSVKRDRSAAAKDEKKGKSAPSSDPLETLLTQTEPSYFHRAYQRYCHPVPASGESDNATAGEKTGTGETDAAATNAPTPSAGDALNGERTLVLCALVSDDRIGREAARVPLRRPRTLLLVLVLLVLCAPVVKLRYLGPRERLHLADVRLVILFVYLASGLVTYGYLDLNLHELSKLQGDSDLESIAKEIASQMRDELSRAADELEVFKAGFLANEDTNRELDYPYVSRLLIFDETGTEILRHLERDGTQTKKPKKPYKLKITDRRYFRKSLKNELWTFPRANGKSQRFAFESLRSRASGQNIAVIAVPAFDGDPPQKPVALMAMEPRSLIDPILPAGYGFAVVNYRGQVLFHSNSSRNLAENLFAETDSSRLQSKVEMRASGHLGARYNGTPHRFFVLPLRDLNWTLVTFRDQSTIDALDTEIAVVWLSYFLLYTSWLALVLLGLWMIGKFDPRDRIRWLWPVPEQRRSYALAGSVVFALVVASGLWLAHSDSAPQRLLVLLFLPIAGTVAAWAIVTSRTAEVASPAPKAAPRTGPATASQAIALNWYVFMLVAILTVVSTAPAAILFVDATLLGRTALIKQEQHAYARSWRSRLESDREIFGDAAPPCSASTWGLYGIANENESGCSRSSEFPSRSLVRQVQACPPGETGSERPQTRYITAHLTNWLPALTLPAPLLYRFAEDHSPAEEWGWCIDDGDLAYTSGGAPAMATAPATAAITLVNDLPSLTLDDTASVQREYRVSLAISLLALGIGLALGIWALRWLVRHLQLIDVVTPPPGSDPVAIDPALVFVRRGCTLDELLDRDATVCDFSQLAPKPGDATNWNKRILDSDVVVVEHLGHHVRSADWENAKLTLLERLLARPDREIVIISRRNPLERRQAERTDTVAYDESSAPPSAETLARWARVMDEFEQTPAEDLPPQTESITVATESPAEPAQTVGLRRESIRAVLAKYRARADSKAYYADIWAECTDAERLALAHLSQEGFLNCNNPAPGKPHVARRLASRNLLTRDPAIRLTDPELGDFISKAVSPEKLRQWEEAAGPSTWSQLRVPLFAGILLAGGLLLVLNPDLGTTAVGVLTALGGLSAVMFRLLSTFGALARKSPLSGDDH